MTLKRLSSLGIVLLAVIVALSTQAGAQAGARLFATLAANLTTGASTPITCTQAGSGCYLDVQIGGGTGTLDQFTTTGLSASTINVTTSLTATTTLPGSLILARKAVLNASYAVLESDVVVAVTSLNLGTTATITLPSATAMPMGKILIVKDESSALTVGATSIWVSGTINQITGTQNFAVALASSRYIAGGPVGSRSWFAW